MDKYNNKGRRLNVSGVLKKLGVSRSGYMSFLRRKPSKNDIRKAKIVDKIQEIYDESHKNYGAPKITKEIQKDNDKSINNVSERTVGKYMRELGIKAQYIKPYTITTIDSNFSSELKNILNEQFNPETPNAYWCSDITYISTYDGFVYLTSIMDLFSRKIIAWTLSKTLEAKWVIETIKKAKRNRNIDNPLVLHSDRGIQYTCKEYAKETQNFITSYSKKAYPWDNACIESFHSLLKREWINRFKIKDYNHAYTLVFEYIETFYNTVRTHSHCVYLSPNDYELKYECEKNGIYTNYNIA